MFVTISTYLAKSGEEDALIALYEDWQHTLRTRVKGYLSGELLRKADVPREFISIMRFESQESVLSFRNDTEQDIWYRSVVTLIESIPVLSEYTSEWH
jgi:heme-degrading monooxygenase HmoA